MLVSLGWGGIEGGCEGAGGGGAGGLEKMGDGRRQGCRMLGMMAEYVRVRERRNIMGFRSSGLWSTGDEKR